MFKLIKNELFKILHKKSTYIVIIITALFMVLVSFIMSKNNIYYSYTENYFDGTNSSGIDAKISEEMNALYTKYDDKTWQYYVMDDMYNIISNYYYNDQDENITKVYNEAKEAISKDDWKYFVNKDLAEEKENLQSLEESLKYASDKDKKELENNIFVTKVAIEMYEYRLKENVSYKNDYINDAINSVRNSASSVKTYETTTNKTTKSDLEEAVKGYYKSRYILENKEDINNTSDLRYLMTNFYSEYIFLILVFGVMIAGAIVSEEYNKGTIKSLLITPYKRSSILLAKFITVIISTLCFIVIAYLMQIFIGGLFLGFGSLSHHVVEYNLATKSLEVMSLFKYVLLYTVATLPQIILLVTLAFAVSTIIGNTALAIVITFAGVIGSQIVNMFATMDKFKFLNYFVTTNWEFNYYLFGGTNPYGPSIKHAIIVCLVYFFIMIVTSFIVFKKKNIKNI